MTGPFGRVGTRTRGRVGSVSGEVWESGIHQGRDRLPPQSGTSLWGEGSGVSTGGSSKGTLRGGRTGSDRPRRGHGVRGVGDVVSTDP